MRGVAQGRRYLKSDYSLLVEYAAADRELPLSVFYGSDILDLEIAEEALKREFS